MIKLMEPMIDPNYKQKKEAQRLRESLMRRLGRKVLVYHTACNVFCIVSSSLGTLLGSRAVL